MSNQVIVAKLFQDVIDDVVKNMKQEFENEGVDDQVLQELQNLWEIKLQELSTKDGGGRGEYEDTQTITESSHVEQQLHMTGSQSLPYPHHGRDGIQQYDGAAGDRSGVEQETSVNNADLYILSKLDEKPRQRIREKRISGGHILQVDGADDEELDDDELDDPDTHDGEKPLDDEDGEGEDLGAGLDSSGESEPDTDDLLLCQFEKVTRTKNKWKTTLKDGVMRISGRDYVFHKGLGEFEW